jgi:hypothetical protein
MRDEDEVGLWQAVEVSLAKRVYVVRFALFGAAGTSFVIKFEQHGSVVDGDDAHIAFRRPQGVFRGAKDWRDAARPEQRLTRHDRRCHAGG